MKLLRQFTDCAREYGQARIPQQAMAETVRSLGAAALGKLSGGQNSVPLGNWAQRIQRQTSSGVSR